MSTGFLNKGQRMLLALLFTCLCLPLTALAQTTSATLLGTLTDANGAVVPGANVKVVNLATGAQREAVTDGDGNYALTFLPAGNYVVTIPANPTLNLKLGQLQDVANTWGAFTQNSYDPRQIEFVMKLRF